MHITTIKINDQEIKVTYDGVNYSFENASEEQLKFLTKLVEKSNIQKNMKLTLLLLMSLYITTPQVKYDSNAVAISKTFTKQNIREIINKYNLTNIEYILKNQNNFWAYYNATMENKSMNEQDQEASLKLFYYVNEYLGYDFENQLKKIQDRNIIVDDEFCQANDAYGMHTKETDDIYLMEETTLDTRIHENIHHHFDFPNSYEIVNNSGQKKPPRFIWGIALEEALASDISGEIISTDGFPDSYPELNTCLQGLYTTFGKENILKILSSPDFLEQLYNELKSCNLDETEIVRFFTRLDFLHSFSINAPMDGVNLDVLKYSLSEHLITIYEAKTGLDWQDSLKMQAIVYALNQRLNIENIKNYETSEGLKYLNETIPFLSKKDFLKQYNIELDFNYLSVVTETMNQNWSGDLSLKIQKEGILSCDEIDTYLYSFEGEKLINQSCYSSWEVYNNTRLEKYQVPKEDWHYYNQDLQFGMSYVDMILDNKQLSEQEKSYFIKKLPDFMALHPEMFEDNRANPMLFTYLYSAYINCTSKEDIIKLFCEEDYLYQNCGDFYLNILREDRIFDKNTQKEILRTMGLYQRYRSIIYKLLSERKITEEEYFSLINEFVSWISKNPELVKFYSHSGEDLLGLLLKDRQSYQSIYDALTKESELLFPIYEVQPNKIRRK